METRDVIKRVDDLLSSNEFYGLTIRRLEVRDDNVVIDLPVYDYIVLACRLEKSCSGDPERDNLVLSFWIFENGLSFLVRTRLYA
jgi:hypothetical protein